VRRIERFTFVVTGITVPYKRTFDGRPCRRALRRVLPGLGLYRVEVTVHTALGASVTLPRIVKVRDYLIVSIGDSLQSDEGVPDERGEYRLSGRDRGRQPAHVGHLFQLRVLRGRSRASLQRALQRRRPTTQWR
jgi:hypothetical protein